MAGGEVELKGVGVLSSTCKAPPPIDHIRIECPYNGEQTTPAPLRRTEPHNLGRPAAGGTWSPGTSGTTTADLPGRAHHSPQPNWVPDSFPDQFLEVTSPARCQLTSTHSGLCPKTCYPQCRYGERARPDAGRRLMVGLDGDHG